MDNVRNALIESVIDSRLKHFLTAMDIKSSHSIEDIAWEYYNTVLSYELSRDIQYTRRKNNASRIDVCNISH